MQCVSPGGAARAATQSSSADGDPGRCLHHCDRLSPRGRRSSLLGVDARQEQRDASRMLASASLALQRFTDTRWSLRDDRIGRPMPAEPRTWSSGCWPSRAHDSRRHRGRLLGRRRGCRPRQGSELPALSALLGRRTFREMDALSRSRSGWQSRAHHLDLWNVQAARWRAVQLRALPSLNRMPPVITRESRIPPPAAGVLTGTRSCTGR